MGFLVKSFEFIPREDLKLVIGIAKKKMFEFTSQRNIFLYVYRGLWKIACTIKGSQEM